VPDAGGLRTVYEVPLDELLGLLSLLRRGQSWAKSNGVTLSPTLEQRIGDMDVAVLAIRRADIGSTGHARTSKASEVGRAGDGPVGTLTSVMSSTEVAVRTGLSVRRCGQLASQGVLAARRAGGVLVFDAASVERFAADREGTL